MSIYNGFGTRQ